MAAYCNRVAKLLSRKATLQFGGYKQTVRWLNLHEFQSKHLMEENGINVQKFQVASSVSEVPVLTKDLISSTGAKELVIKAQILAGGRGKGTFDNGFKGGVHLTTDVEKVPDIVKSMLGHRLTTKQTDSKGVKVQKVMIAQALDIVRETYFAIVMDRTFNGPVMVGSPQGGMDIEEVAKSTPELIFKEPIDIMTGMKREQAVAMAQNLGFTGDMAQTAADQIEKLYDLFLHVDATQIEINPLGVTPQDEVVCFDAKINFDDNSQFRQEDIFSQEDKAELDPREVEAAEANLNYIGLQGNIGCLVNGAGLAMATMDIVQLYGGKPANFLDVGGGVTVSQVFKAFKLISSDPQVEVILVNVFGGIVNCATIANGIKDACRELDLRLPVVIRLEGTNVDEAKSILIRSGLDIKTVSSFEECAQWAVSLVKGKATA